MFIDETEIAVESGRGGDGLVSFRREKFVPRGGPDGGDGGRGGDVLMEAVSTHNTLGHLQHRRLHRAESGRPGGPRNRHGRRGRDLVIEVPVGTLVRDAERGHVLRDLTAAGERFVVVAGGAGGRGNKHFAGPTHQVPREASPGRPGSRRNLRLELRLVADIGLVGLPNAGKSTFLRRVSRARPKVADYPFTTLEPVLGVVERGGLEMVVADIPGLIAGAHRGAGLGDRFLRHVDRTHLLLHLVDASVGPEGVVADYRTVRRELLLAATPLGERPTVLALSRADLVADPGPAVEALAAAAGAPVHVLSAATGRGVGELLGVLGERLQQIREADDRKTVAPSSSKGSSGCTGPGPAAP